MEMKRQTATRRRKRKKDVFQKRREKKSASTQIIIYDICADELQMSMGGDTHTFLTPSPPTVYTGMFYMQMIRQQH